MSKVGVTGGAGFVGTNLVRELLKHGHEVIVVDDLSAGLLSNIEGLEIDFVKTSITDFKSLKKALLPADCIFHLAARGSVPRSIQNPRATFEVNVTGTQNVLEVARENGAKVIFSSSSSVYGSNQDLPKKERMWMSPISPYAASKLAGEALVQSYAKSYGLVATSFRFFNIFGPFQRPDHDYAAVIPKWIWKAMNNQPLEIYGDGHQTRDFTYVMTVVQALIATLDTSLRHEDPINLAFGNRISLNDVIIELREFFPSLDTHYLPARLGDVVDSQNDPSYLNSVLPKITPVSFADSLAATVDWFSQDISKVLNGPKVLD